MLGVLLVGVFRGDGLSIEEDVLVFDLVERRDVSFATHQADSHLFLFIAS